MGKITHRPTQITHQGDTLLSEENENKTIAYYRQDMTELESFLRYRDLWRPQKRGYHTILKLEGNDPDKRYKNATTPHLSTPPGRTKEPRYE